MSDENRRDLKILGLILVAFLIVLLVFLTVAEPMVHATAVAFGEGVGLKTAAIWSFGVTVVLFILFALVAGDGLFGELQFMLGAFFTFFVVIALLIAWVF